MSSRGHSALTGGIICALTTPFGADQKPDVDAFGDLIERQIAGGINGLFVAGTSGEGPLMNRGERRLVTEAVVEKVAGRVPIVVHCGAADTRTSEHLALHAQSVGADAAAVVAPYFYRFSPEELYGHFRDVAQAAPEIPHYIYENPERVGYSLGVEMVGRLTSDISNIVGIKDTGDSLGRLLMYLSVLDPVPEVYTGNNTLVFSALSAGAEGAVSALANVAPRLFVAIYDAFQDGKAEDSLRLQQVAVRLQACFAGLPYVPAVKHVLALTGVEAGASRRPHGPLSVDQARTLEARIASGEGLAEWLDAPGT
jgi:dihydrodipicolinate synthase/N-acetylneuraminate lyase